FNQPGKYYFSYKAYDQLGNSDETNPLSIVIDNRPPSTTFNTSRDLVEKNDHFISGIPNVLTLQADDDGVGVEKIEISYDGKNFTQYDQSIDFATWRSANQKLYFRSIDRLGNREEMQTINIIVRNAAPKVDLFV